LLLDSIQKRFRSDVPVGINVSGGLDSSILVGVVRAVQGSERGVKAFTFTTGDSRYDELPWVRSMLATTRHPSVICELAPADVPVLADSVQAAQDEPFSGIPTLAYARLFERARAEHVPVLLDGQGLDEQWAGYDYYAAALAGRPAGVVQGTTAATTVASCLVPEFRALSLSVTTRDPFADSLRNIQYRDVTQTKLPRALRFNDRVSMRSSVELREPFLDHRLFELALRQPPERKIKDGVHKWLLRRIADRLVPAAIAQAPKRPIQTPQREWLRGELREWADGCIEAALARAGGQWLDSAAVRSAWATYCDGVGDSSFHVWQWINLGLMSRQEVLRPRKHIDRGLPHQLPQQPRVGVDLR
jgi:asparagine synthase (glutamine-hydrolysing)